VRATLPARRGCLPFVRRQLPTVERMRSRGSFSRMFPVKSYDKINDMTGTAREHLSVYHNPHGASRRLYRRTRNNTGRQAFRVSCRRWHEIEPSPFSFARLRDPRKGFDARAYMRHGRPYSISARAGRFHSRILSMSFSWVAPWNMWNIFLTRICSTVKCFKTLPAQGNEP
jgi:hypothetical protein